MATRTDTQSPALHVADRHDLIRVQGARENNLKDFSVELPKRQLTVFTGVSARARARANRGVGPAARPAAVLRQGTVVKPAREDLLTMGLTPRRIESGHSDERANYGYAGAYQHDRR